MRRARVIAVMVVLACARPGSAGARPASSTRPAIHAAEVIGDTLALRVRFGGGGPVALTRVTAQAGGRSHAIDLRRVSARPCGVGARVVVVVAVRGAAPPEDPVLAGTDRGAARQADEPVPVDAVGVAVTTALSSLPDARVATWVVGRDHAFSAFVPASDALAGLSSPAQPPSRGALEIAFRAIDAALGTAPGQRRIALVVTAGDADTGALAEPARQLVEGERGVELYELVLAPRGHSSTDPLGAYAPVGRAADAWVAGDLIGAELDRCLVVGIPLARLPTGPVELALDAGGASDRALRRSVVLPGHPRADRRSWWYWSGAALALVAAVVLLRGSRRSSGSRRVRGDQVPVRATLATPGPGAGGRRSLGLTLPLAPMQVEARDEHGAAPVSPGLAGWFVLYQRGGPAATFVLQPVGVTTIGRDRSQSLCIDDPTVSQQHARVIVKGDRFVIEDAGSSNGLRVDGRPALGERPLRDGAKVELGSVRLVFKCTP